MNERYTYGYNIGWNVENGYIDDVRSILNEYNNQSGILEQINIEKQELESYVDNIDEEIRSLEENIEKQNISDDKIREWYYQDKDNLNLTFAAYSELINKEIEKRKDEIRKKIEAKEQEKESFQGEFNLNLERNQNKYFANLYYLIQKKEQARKDLNAKKGELSLKLREANLQLQMILLEQAKTQPIYDENRNIMNSKQLIKLREEYDNLWLEIRKLEHAIREIDDMLKEMELTKEESELLMRGLNPQQKKMYDEINKNPIPGPVPEPIPDPTLQLDNEIDLSGYEAALKEYDKLLEEYNRDLKELYRLQQAYENGEIEFSLYENYANYIKERYDNVLEKYNEIYELYQETKKRIDEYNKRISLNEAELLQQLQELEEEYNKEYYYRAHLENGMESHQDDYLDELQRKINKIKEELNKTNKQIREPIKPEKPNIILEKEKEEENDLEGLKDEYFDLHDILDKIGGGYKFNKLDNFIYTHKDVKWVNYNKSKARTFIDKPYKLIKTGIGTLINTPLKIFSIVANMLPTNSKERIDALLANVERLREEEIDVLIRKLSPGAFKANSNVLPEIVWNAIYNKMYQRAKLKTDIANSKIDLLYKEIITDYKKAVEIKNKLSNNVLSELEKNSLSNEYKSLSNNLLINMTELYDVYETIDALANASGLHGMKESFRARKNNKIGGVNSSDKYHLKELSLAGRLGRQWKDAMNDHDGVKAAEMFLFKQKVFIENTKQARTLKNRFGEASVGAFDFSPYIEFIDYSEDTFWNDVIHSVVLVTGIVNTINQVQLRNALNQANQQIVQQNAQIAQQNIQIANAEQELVKLNSIISKYTSNPDEFMQEYYTFIDNQISSIQGASEYYAMTSQAAANNTSLLVSSGSIYNSTDNAQHILSGDYSRQLQSIYTNPNLSFVDKTKQMGDILTKTQENFQDIVITHSKGMQNYLSKYGNIDDFRAIEQAMNLISSGNPSYISNLISDLTSLSIQTNNISAINQLSQINLDVPILPQLVPVVTMIGKDNIETYRKNKDKKKNEDEEILELRKEALANQIMEVPIDTHEKAKQNYERAMQEWNENSVFYRLIHKKSAPSLVDEEKKLAERGRVL